MEGTDHSESAISVGGAEMQSIPEGMETVPSTTTQQQLEIMRRQDAAAHVRGCDEQSSFDRVEDQGEDPPFKASDQQWVLYSLSHVAMPPMARDPSNPAVRIYGLFESHEDANEYATELHVADPACCILLSTTHEWHVAAKSSERHSDLQYKSQKLQRIAKAHAELRVASTTEFRRNVDEGQTGGQDLPTEDTLVNENTRERRRAQHDDTWEELQRDGKKATNRLPGSLVIEGQRHAVCCFAKDVTPEVVSGEDDPEFAFMVLAAFDTESQCDRYVRNVAAERIQDQALDVITLRRWIFPEHPDLEENVAVVYRHKELTEVMQRKKADVGEVERFKREQERIGRPVEIKDIITETTYEGGDEETDEVTGPTIEEVPDEVTEPAQQALIPQGETTVHEFEADLFGEEECKASHAQHDGHID
jgi:hypothetical protein